MTKKNFVFLLNSFLLICEIIGITWMFVGFKESGPLSSSRFSSLRYFTVDSNILMGIISLIIMFDMIKYIKSEKEDLSIYSYVLAFIGTVGVTLTMLVTIFFLVPTMGPKYGYLSLFSGSNFFLHLVNPILSLVLFLGFLRTDKIKIVHTIYGIIPMIIYAIYYLIAALMHVEDGKIVGGYDWYGFLIGGIYSAFIVIPIFILVTYLISFGLYRFNKVKTN